MSPRILALVLCFAGQAVARRVNVQVDAHEPTTTGQKCCCATGNSCDGAKGGFHYQCLAFVKHPKCCKFMDKCETKSTGIGGLFNKTKYFKSEADKALCIGEVEVPEGHKGSPANLDCSANEKAAAAAKPISKLHFFDKLNGKPNRDLHAMNRDYTIIVDKSGSMGGQEEVHVPQKIADAYKGKMRAGTQRMSLWKEAEAALAFLAGPCVEEDSDGISLIFFSSDVHEVNNVKSADAVMSAFQGTRPGGVTYLDKALEVAVQPDNVGKAETILVITDGVPTDAVGVESEIVKAAKQLCRDEDLAITFIQVGTDQTATAYLQYLDDELQCKYKIYDIVDAVTADGMQRGGFLDLITKGITD